jgi:hypothetical protein
MPTISYFRRGKRIWTSNYGSMRAAKSSIALTLARHHKADGIDSAELRDDEGKLRLRLPGKR